MKTSQFNSLLTSILNEANISNLDALKEFLDSLQASKPNVVKWIGNNLRKYLINSKTYHKPLKELPKDSPQWLVDKV